MVPSGCKESHGTRRGNSTPTRRGALPAYHSRPAAAEGWRANPPRGTARQEGGDVRSSAMQAKGPRVSETTKQGPEAQSTKWAWVEASIWTDRMLAALGNGVQGGKFEYRLRSSWTVHSNRGPYIGEPISMKKPPTGELYAGEPPVQFGGRDGVSRSRPLSKPQNFHFATATN